MTAGLLARAGAAPPYDRTERSASHRLLAHAGGSFERTKDRNI
jgi:hypothetical protein